MAEQSVKPLIFVASANEQVDHIRYLRKPPDKMRRLWRALEQAGEKKLCQLEVRTNTTLSDIRDVFYKYDNHIAVFHFDGHPDTYYVLIQSLPSKTHTRAGSVPGR